MIIIIIIIIIIPRAPLSVTKASWRELLMKTGFQVLTEYEYSSQMRRAEVLAKWMINHTLIQSKKWKKLNVWGWW
jgi:hypothetical protein